MGATLRGQGVWTVGFDHVPNNPPLLPPPIPPLFPPLLPPPLPQILPPPPVHPDSDSIHYPGLWITENLPPEQQVPPHVPGQRMNTVHVCLIPAGVHRGEVLVWDGNLGNYGVRAFQPWAIVNPYWPAANPNYWPGQPTAQYRFHNALLAMPVGQGELFCAGQCWMPDGRLLVCGGTKSYPSATQDAFEGTRFVFQWDPEAQPGDPFGRWYLGPDLEAPRWYPSVTFDGTFENRAIVTGGTNWTPAGPPYNVNSYEVVRPAFNSLPYPGYSDPPFDHKPQPTQPVWDPGFPWSDRQYWGPTPPYPIFTDYPRIHALGILDPIVGGVAPRLFVSGMDAWGIHWAHDATQDPVFGEFPVGVGYDFGWTPINTDDHVHYATALLVPAPIGLISSYVARVGGDRCCVTNGPSNLVDTASITTPGPWFTSGEGSIPPMNHARYFGNVVMLPNGDWFAVGGESAPGVGNLIPELFDGTSWTDMAPHPGARAYHSAAILLPDARVFVCGGETRSDPASPGPDYLVWEPPYFHFSYGSVPATGITVRNEFTSQVVQQHLIGQGMEYGQIYRANWTNTLEPGILIDRVVLMRPAALTHHDDGGQRLIRLNAWLDGPNSSVVFESPASVLHAPPGWWMLFLVNSMGRPSLAYWVNLR